MRTPCLTYFAQQNKLASTEKRYAHLLLSKEGGATQKKFNDKSSYSFLNKTAGIFSKKRGQCKGVNVISDLLAISQAKIHFLNQAIKIIHGIDISTQEGQHEFVNYIIDIDGPSAEIFTKYNTSDDFRHNGYKLNIHQETKDSIIESLEKTLAAIKIRNLGLINMKKDISSVGEVRAQICLDILYIKMQCDYEEHAQANLEGKRKARAALLRNRIDDKRMQSNHYSRVMAKPECVRGNETNFSKI